MLDKLENQIDTVLNSKQESNSVNVGQNPKITPSPRKSSLNLNNNDGSLGFTEDPIMGRVDLQNLFLSMLWNHKNVEAHQNKSFGDQQF